MQSAEIKSEDAVYVLAYSVILLNTDLHNPQVRVCTLKFALYASLISRTRNECHSKSISEICEASMMEVISRQNSWYESVINALV